MSHKTVVIVIIVTVIAVGVWLWRAIATAPMLEGEEGDAPRKTKTKDDLS
jgi:hypothetical protein